MLQTLLPYAILAFILLVSPSKSFGITLCSGPMRPTCIEMDFTYESRSSALRCEQSLERFVEESRTYVQCLKTLIEETRMSVSDATAAFRTQTEKNLPNDNGGASTN